MQVLYKYKDIKQLFKFSCYKKLPYLELICISTNKPVKYVVGWPFVASNIMKD